MTCQKTAAFGWMIVSRYHQRVRAEEDSEIVKVASESIAAMLAAGAGIMGPPEAALIVASAAPALTRALENMANRVSSLRRQRCGQVYMLTAELSGMSIDELTEQVLDDEKLLDLFSRVLLTVQDMALDDHRRSLARVLASTALEPTPARLDISFLIESAIRDLHNGHVRYMTVLAPEPRRPGIASDEGTFGLRLKEVVERDHGLNDGAYAILQSLLSHGLVEDSTGGMTFLESVRTYTLSAFGQRIFKLLSDEGFGQILDSTSPIA
jgi:hypothetical protein